MVRENEHVAEIRWSRPEEAEYVAKALLEQALGCKIWLFSGDLGAGKTTLIQALCRALGIEDTVSSPTFPIIHEYRTRTGDFVYHFDFYRIKTTEEAFDTGCEEYFDSGCYCFIEWPDTALPLIRERSFKIDIILGENEERILQCKIL